MSKKMNRIHRLFLLIVVQVATISSLFALSPGWQEISDYTENFSTASVSGGTFSSLPDYWNVMGGGAVWAVSSGTVGSGSNLASNTTDYLITPQVKGDITLRARYSAYSARSTAQLRVFKCSLEGDTYVIGEQVFVTEGSMPGSLTLYHIVDAADEYSYYAIQPSQCYIDDFTATSAYVNVPADPQFQPIAISRGWSDTNPIYADASGNAVWTGTIKVKNTGNVDLVSGTENFALTVSSQATYAVTTTMTSFAIPENLAIGEEKEFAVEVPITLAKREDGRTAVRFTTQMMPVGTTASTSANYQQSDWFTLKTVDPKLLVKNSEGYDVTAYTTELGLKQSPASIPFTLDSRGGSAVVLTSIESSFADAMWLDGENEVEFPLTVEMGTQKTITLVLTQIGGQESTLTFNYGNTYDETTYSVVSKKVSAVLSDPTAYLEEFDRYLTVPTGWCQPGWVNQKGSNWIFTSSSSNTYASNNLQAIPEAYLITPLLSIREGENFTVSAQPKTNPATSDCFVKVLYSADRINWQVAGYVGYLNGSGNATKPSAEGVEASKVQGWSVTQGTGSLNSNYCKPYVVNGIPAGNWYIGFQSGYSIIDYVMGGMQVELDHDIYIDQFKAPGKGKVNYQSAISFVYANMRGVAEENYMVELLNGNDVIASFQKTLLEAYATDTICYDFTPHAAGTYHLQMRITLGESVYSSSVVDMTVAAEEAVADALVGERTSSTSLYVPLSLGYNNSMAEFIYPAEKLPIEEGTIITGVSFPFYSEGKEIISQVSVYMENTEEETVTAFSDTALLQRVYANAQHKFEPEGRTAEHALMSFTFTEPFVYTGQNIRMVCVSEQANTFSYYYFEYVTAQGAAVYKRNDNYNTYLGLSPSAVSNLPVIYLSHAIHTPKVSGVVKNGNDLLADAKVCFSSDFVTYETMSDAEGHYDVTIMQPERKYVMTIEAEGIDPYVSDSLSFGQDTIIDVVLGDNRPEAGTVVLAPVFKVTAVTGDNLKGIKLKLANELFGLVYPEATLNAAGCAKISNVLNGPNRVSIDATSLGLKLFSEEIDIESNDTIYISLQEAVREPYALKASLERSLYSFNNEVTFTWNQESDYFFDDFESYEPFAVDFAPWTGIDGDQEPTAQISGTYANAQIPQYATIFNPLVIEPSLWADYPVLRPYSGQQYVGVIRTASGAANNDWIISPRIHVGVDNIVEFMAKAADRTNENFRVGISTTGTAMSDFTMLSTGNYESVDYKQWTSFAYSLADYEGDSVYICIQCVSKEAFMLMIDDFYLGPRQLSGEAHIGNAAPNEKFHVYLDNNFVAEVSETGYRFENIESGTHTLGVKAVYRTTETDTVSMLFNVPDNSAYGQLFLNLCANATFSTDDVVVKIREIYTNVDITPRAADETNTIHLLSLPVGTYAITAELEGFSSYADTINHVADDYISINFFENVAAPRGLYLKSLTESEEGGVFAAELLWNTDNGFSDDFESYTPFSQQFGDYVTYDGDEVPCYQVSFGGQTVRFGDFGTYGKVSALIFNPYATVPQTTEDDFFCALSGKQYVVFMSPQQSQADDWLIAPKQTIGEDYVVRFYARAYSAAYNELLEVCVSSTYDDNDVPNDYFESLGSMDVINNGGAWALYEVSLADYVGQDLEVAIHYISTDKWIAQVDDLYIGPKEGASSSIYSRVVNYQLYLDGEAVGNTTATHYLFEGLSEGTHTLGVQAVYESGCTEIVSLNIDAVTDIRAIEAKTSDAIYYDLLGRRVKSSRSQGILLRK